ncbi:MAG: tRNA (adenosine(37)-N6)-threonylcarbamoyltransferase complex dimerization subunit type 1 TsaB [Planctomycetaceae bacterium]|nr:tRNA (adenosine(37)-N6)-threonylcarbamoyltransferase complex dimerization subunit type 1 TsaB [Planctomycetaceae bacterium]
MNILALDTSTDRAALAVATAAGSIHAATPDPTSRHGRNLVPAIGAALRAAGLAARDLDLIAVGLGPGSYTGLRVGLTAAKTLAYVAQVPLVGLDSLEAIARNAPAEALRVSVIADAQRGDVYTADFRRSGPSGPLLRTSPTRIEPLERWSAHLSEPGSEPVYVLGPGLDRLRPELPGNARAFAPGANWPDGRHLIGLARDAWDAGRRDDPWFLEPFYLRRSAAEDQWQGGGKP